ncbi:NADP-dependent oxidoreductase domain-containing protein [Neurospora tetraspora]|uniref:NADP-dependent oxidoreductase domain-containing protein n=1 Tax=Neurospora tetraspora TaxID=94610 RepID=A0AAE0JMT0_9PEZI|nr:NADP-dependent oxidoreductase domain-containing protein [Neurospora tetraspora]
MATKTFKLNTGADIPALGLGTWQGESTLVKDAVVAALKAGYRLIDTAYCYGNEEHVGAGLKEAFDQGIVKREDVFVVTKLWATYASRAEVGLEKSLRNLGLEYVDLFLVHWPLLMNPEGNDDRFPKLPNGERDILRDYSHIQIWKNMEKLVESGKTKAIGVSNYSKRYLEELLPHATIVPAVNQIENHPQLPQQEIVDFCKEKGIHIMAYSPFGSTGSPVTSAEPVVKVAEKHGVKPTTVLLSYHLYRGSTVLPKSTNPDRIEANAKLIELDAEDQKLLNDYSEQLVKEGKVQRYIYPPFGVDFGFPDKS